MNYAQQYALKNLDDAKCYLKQAIRCIEMGFSAEECPKKEVYGQLLVSANKLYRKISENVTELKGN